MYKNNKGKYKDTDARFNIRLDEHSKKFLKLVLEKENVTIKDYFTKLVIEDLSKKDYLLRLTPQEQEIFDNLKQKYHVSNINKNQASKELLNIIKYAYENDEKFLMEILHIVRNEFDRLLKFYDKINEMEQERTKYLI